MYSKAALLLLIALHLAQNHQPSLVDYAECLASNGLTTCDIGSQLCNMVHLYTVTSTSSIVISVAHMAHICHVTVDNGDNSFPSQPYSL